MSEKNVSNELHDEINNYNNAIQIIRNTSFEVDSLITLPKFFFIPYRPRYEDYALSYEKTNNSINIIYTKEIDDFYKYVKSSILKLNSTEKLNEHANVYLTGYEGSGKSTCLEVCAARLKAEQFESLPNIRVLYIHDIERFIDQPIPNSNLIFLKELLLTFDHDIEINIKIKKLIDKFSTFEFTSFEILLSELSNYIVKNKLIFISIWDQVNSCYELNGKLKHKAYPEVTNNKKFIQPAYYHYQGIFSRMRNQINICGGSFNNSSKLTRFKNEKNQDINWHKYPFLNSFCSVNEKRVLLEFFTPFKKLFNSIEIKMEMQNGEKLDLDVNQTVTLVDKWTNMLPLSIALLSQELEKATVNDQNSTDFNTTFDFFIYNQKKIISTNHARFRNEMNDKLILDKYVMSMMLNLKVSQRDINTDYLDEKNMFFLPEKQGTNKCNTLSIIGKIVPINLIALVAFEELYRNNENFSSTYYVNDLTSKYINYQSDSVTFSIVVESLIRFYLKLPHFASIFLELGEIDKIDKSIRINYLDFSNYQFQKYSYNHFQLTTGFNIIIPLTQFNMIAFDFIIIQRYQNYEKKIKFIQCSTSNNFYDHMKSSMQILSNNIESYKRLFDLKDDDFNENVEYHWILDERQIKNIEEKQNEVKNWPKEKIQKLIESRNSKILSKKDQKKRSLPKNENLDGLKLETGHSLVTETQTKIKSNISADENMAFVFNFKNHKFIPFEFLGKLFNCDLLNNYSYFKDGRKQN